MWGCISSIKNCNLSCTASMFVVDWNCLAANVHPSHWTLNTSDPLPMLRTGSRSMGSMLRYWGKFNLLAIWIDTLRCICLCITSDSLCIIQPFRKSCDALADSRPPNSVVCHFMPRKRQIVSKSGRFAGIGSQHFSTIATKVSRASFGTSFGLKTLLMFSTSSRPETSWIGRFPVIIS